MRQPKTNIWTLVLAVAFALVVTILALIRSVAPDSLVDPVPPGERLVVVSTIWLTVILALLRKRARRTFKWISLAGGPWEPNKPIDQPNNTHEPPAA